MKLEQRHSVARSFYLRRIARRTQGAASVLTPPRIIMRGVNDNRATEFASNTASTPGLFVRTEPSTRRKAAAPVETEQMVAAEKSPVVTYASVDRGVELEMTASPEEPMPVTMQGERTPIAARPNFPQHIGERPSRDIDAVVTPDPVLPISGDSEETTANLVRDNFTRTIASHQSGLRAPRTIPSAAMPLMATSAIAPSQLVGPSRKGPDDPSVVQTRPEAAQQMRTRIIHNVLDSSFSSSPTMLPHSNFSPDKLEPAAETPQQTQSAVTTPSYAAPEPLRPVRRTLAVPATSEPRLEQAPITPASRLAAAPPIASALKAAFEWVTQPAAGPRKEPSQIDHDDDLPVPSRSAIRESRPQPPLQGAPLAPPVATPVPVIGARRWEAPDQGRTIHIGSIEVRIDSPVPPMAPFPHPQAQAVRDTPPNSKQTLARGFATTLGLRQG
jgi:hypothetical protein